MDQRSQDIYNGNIEPDRRNPREVRLYRKGQDDQRLRLKGQRIQDIYAGKEFPDRQNYEEMVYFRQGDRDRRKDEMDYDEYLQLIFDGYTMPDEDIEEEVTAYLNGRTNRGEIDPVSDDDDSIGQQCMICEKIVPLFQCAECKDSAYCSQQCQIQGCGNKHL